MGTKSGGVGESGGEDTVIMVTGRGTCRGSGSGSGGVRGGGTLGRENEPGGWDSTFHTGNTAVRFVPQDRCAPPAATV